MTLHRCLAIARYLACVSPYFIAIVVVVRQCSPAWTVHIRRWSAEQAGSWATLMGADVLVRDVYIEDLGWRARFLVDSECLGLTSLSAMLAVLILCRCGWVWKITVGVGLIVLAMYANVLRIAVIVRFTEGSVARFYLLHDEVFPLLRACLGAAVLVGCWVWEGGLVRNDGASIRERAECVGLCRRASRRKLRVPTL